MARSSTEVDLVCESCGTKLGPEVARGMRVGGEVSEEAHCPACGKPIGDGDAVPGPESGSRRVLR
jgi:hypothetical protein